MKQTPFLRLNLNRIFLILCLFAQLQDRVFCDDDPKYTECAPLKCGDLNISYPFFIKDRQKPYCGAPGFDLTCANNNTTPILHIPENNYLVKNIFYNNRSILVANAEVAFAAAADAGCLPDIKNLSLTEHKFNLSHSVSKLFLFSNCSSPPPTNLEQHKIEFCQGGSVVNGLAMVEPGREDWSSAMVACPKEVVALVGIIDGDHNWLEVMKRGFTLDWIASDCSECSESGGRCGFDTGDLIFRCFCPDRVHRVSCKPNPAWLMWVLVITY